MTGVRLLCVAGVAAAALGPAAVGRAPAPPRIVAVAVGREVATGFAAGGDRVVTVAHVLDGGGAVTVDGRVAAVVRVDRGDDLAVLALRGLRAPALRTASGAGAVRVLARSGDRRARVRRHIVATVRGDAAAPASRRPALDLAADVAPGDSGAPVVDARGRVVGVLFASSSGRARTAYAVDAAALGALLAPR
jgi:S1-C subfamily serine protease